MDPKDRERKLDAWLDEALTHYNDAEPRAGLEQRVLANVRAAEVAARRRWWVKWTPALAAVAAVVIVVAVKPMWRAAPTDVHKVEIVSQLEPSRDVKVEPAGGAKATDTADKSGMAGGKLGGARVAGRSVRAAKTNSGRTADAHAAEQDLTADSSTKSVGRAETARAQAVGRDAEMVTAPVPMQRATRVATEDGYTSQAVARSVPLPERNSVTSPVMVAKGLPMPLTGDTISREERLMLEAAMNGGLQPAREQMPPKDELLPMVEIPAIKISNLNISEK